MDIGIENSFERKFIDRVCDHHHCHNEAALAWIFSEFEQSFDANAVLFSHERFFFRYIQLLFSVIQVQIGSNFQ